MLKSFNYAIVGKLLSGLLILIVGLGLFSFQPLAHASTMTSEKALTQIDSIRFGREYDTGLYTSALNILSDRCSSTPEHIADLTALSTDYLYKNDLRFDNLSFLKQALEATANGTYGNSCEEIFALLTTMIESGV